VIGLDFLGDFLFGVEALDSLAFWSWMDEERGRGRGRRGEISGAFLMVKYNLLFMKMRCCFSFPVASERERERGEVLRFIVLPDDDLLLMNYVFQSHQLYVFL